MYEKLKAKLLSCLPSSAISLPQQRYVSYFYFLYIYFLHLFLISSDLLASRNTLQGSWIRHLLGSNRKHLFVRGTTLGFKHTYYWNCFWKIVNHFIILKQKNTRMLEDNLHILIFQLTFGYFICTVSNLNLLK